MKRSKERGEMLEPILILLALLAILIFFIIPRSGSKWPDRSLLRGERSASETQGSNGPSSTVLNSAYSRNVSLNMGNAKYSYNPVEEYITVTNRGSDPVNITGWRLVNGKGGRVSYVGGQSVVYPSDEVIIPKAVGYLSPSGFNVGQDVILKPGEQAIITSGSISLNKPLAIVSFKENKCSGYLEEYDYPFTPSLSKSCTRPGDEPGLNLLPFACREFVNRINTCHVPKFTERDKLVDGTEGLTSQCKAFIKERFNYAGCIANHANDSDFYENTWRIFLGRQWEIWAENDEEIKLYDQFGKLVDYISY